MWIKSENTLEIELQFIGNKPRDKLIVCFENDLK